MPSKKHERQRLHRIYNQLYERHYIEERYMCFYCNDFSDGVDHVPPLSWVEPYGADSLRKSGYPFSLLPCCSECNTALGDRKLLSVEERLDYLLARYTKAMDKITYWSETEIEGMGPAFKPTLKARKARRDEYERKVKAVEQRIAKPWTFPDPKTP